MTSSHTPQGSRRNMALLIDGDNAQPSLIGEILAETTKYGTITVRRVYGDWTTPQMGPMEENPSMPTPFRPQQQFPHTSGKNATDSALIHRRYGPAPLRPPSAGSVSSQPRQRLHPTAHQNPRGRTVRDGNWQTGNAGILRPGLRGVRLYDEPDFGGRKNARNGTQKRRQEQ